MCVMQKDYGCRGKGPKAHLTMVGWKKCGDGVEEMWRWSYVGLALASIHCKLFSVQTNVETISRWPSPALKRLVVLALALPIWEEGLYWGPGLPLSVPGFL